VTTAVSGDTLTVTGPDLSSYATGSSTTTFTNKTFDANGTGNSISNIETADIAAGTLVTAAEGIGSNNNDTTIPTSAAVKAYADSVGGGGGGTITALNNQAENRLVSIGATTTELDGEANLTFDGSTLSLTGSAALDGVTIADNLITTNRSNDDLRLSANGTGRIGISTDSSDFWNNALYQQYYGNPNGVVKTLGVSSVETVDANTAARNYVLGVAQNTTLSGSSTSNSNFRQRTLNLANSLDMAGYSFTQVSSTRGPKAASFGTNVVNTGTTASTLYTANPAEFYCSAWGESGYAEGDITITAPVGVKAVMEVYSGGGSGNFTYTDARGFFSKAYVHTNDTITDHYLYHAQPGNDGAGGTITNSYGYYVAASTGGVGTNYAFYDASNSLSVFGDIQTQAVSITDNLITTNRSNDSLFIGSNGTGRIELSTDGGQLGNSPTYPKYHFSPSRVKGVVLSRETSTNIDALTSREYGHVLHYGTTVTNGSTNNSNWNPRSVIFSSHTNMDGESYTNASNGRGPVGLFTAGTANNSSGSSASTLYNLKASVTSAGIADYEGSPTQNMTIDRCIATESAVMIETNGTSTNTITDAYNFYSAGYIDAAAGNTNTITNLYGFYHASSHGTNNYAFYDAANALSRFGAVILANQSGDPSTVTDSAHIYAKDVTSSSEVFVRDEAGNVTQISPHNEAGEWQYWSENIKTGKKVRVNMERMIRKLEEITGETFIENE